MAETDSRTAAADAELCRAVMEYHLAEAADYGIYGCIEAGLAEAIRAEEMKKEGSRLAAAKERLEEVIEARNCAGKGRKETVPIGLLGVHALVNIVTGMLRNRPSMQEDFECAPLELWVNALHVADYTLHCLIPTIPKPGEGASHD
jgi:hypothetical protein